MPAPTRIADADPERVARVLFLVGDPGMARRDRYPLLTRLQQDIEWWAERLPTDSAVSVLFLGDIVYPLGLHAPGTKEYPADSAVVSDQVLLLSGPFARQRLAQGYFMAGNHDWGLERDWEGFDRLRTLDAFLERARERRGAHVRLVPEAGRGGPYVIDLGEHARLLILDTAWWLLDGGKLTGSSQTGVLARVDSVIADAGDRHILFAAHHPFRSAGPHGGEFSFWRTAGVRYLLARSGAILQDISSIPYRDLERGLRDIFARRGAPRVFIGGHEHSLQIFRAVRPTDPAYSLVSGAASKVSDVSWQEGIEFGLSAPGYMRLVIEKDGGLAVYVEAAPRQFHVCPEEGPERDACMAQGVGSIRTVHSQRLD